MYVRQAVEQDVAALTDLMGALGYPTEGPAVAARLAEIQADRSSSVLVAIDGQRVLGVVGLHWTRMLHLEAPVARITTLVVREDARGQDVGRTLVEAATHLAQAAGCETLELTSGLGRTDAHAFYRHLGFEQSSYRFRRPLVTEPEPDIHGDVELHRH